jgi:hypothetical protein
VPCSAAVLFCSWEQEEMGNSRWSRIFRPLRRDGLFHQLVPICFVLPTHPLSQAPSCVCVCVFTAVTFLPPVAPHLRLSHFLAANAVETNNLRQNKHAGVK